MKIKRYVNSPQGTKSLNVFIQFSKGEILVGKLILENRLVYFKYDDEFLKLQLNLSPFKLKFNNSIQLADPIPFHGIFGLFDDSLPDDWGMLLLNRALEKKGLSLDDINILDQLAYVGETGKGALIYRPALTEAENLGSGVNIDLIKTAMDEVYEGSTPELIDELMFLGGSSGGARPKVNVGYSPETDEIIHGRSVLPDGFQHWIIKFPSSYDPKDIANIEFAYYKMAKAAGIEMSDSKLLKSAKGIQVFATKRFDRIGNKRLHMHSMAGLTHDNFRLSNIDYGHIIDVAYQLEKNATAREKALRLAAFNVFSYNLDDHSKNFSWLMDENGSWSMSPAYDLTYSSAAINEHSTLVNGEGANPGRKQLLELAEIFSIRKANDIIKQVQYAISSWPDFAADCGVSTISMIRIQKKLKEVRD